MRPCWIVLAPGVAANLAPAIRRIADDPVPWDIVEGKGYVAVVEPEPGSQGANDEALAKALSAKSKKPAYVLWLDDEMPRVEAFAAGKSKGDVKASPDDVLFTLGFRFDWMSRGRKVALRVEAPMVKAKRGEAMIWNWSVSQWQQMMRRDGDWYMLLDAVGSKTVDQILAICDDDDAAVRFLGATMLSHVGYYGLDMAKRLEPGLAALATLVEDRSPKVRAAAIEAHDEIVERGEYEGVRAELSWILNYDKTHVKAALALLDEDRPIVHRYLYQWFSQGIWNDKGLPKPAVAKLKQLAKTVPEAKALLTQLAER